MRTIGVLPKSVLILEYLGMILLALALLSLNPLPYAARAVQYAAGWRIDGFPGRRVDPPRRGGDDVAYCAVTGAAVDETSTRHFFPFR